MNRIKKLLGILFILGFVFFIICDEKGYKIGFENNQIIFVKTKKKTDLVSEEPLENVVYKNSDLVHIFIGFNNGEFLRKSDGLDPEYSAKKKEEQAKERAKKKAEEKVRRQSQKYKGPNIISLDNENIFDIIKSDTDSDISYDSSEFKSKISETEPEKELNITDVNNKENRNILDTVKINTDSDTLNLYDSESESERSETEPDEGLNVTDKNNEDNETINEDLENEDSPIVLDAEENIQDVGNIIISKDSETDNNEGREDSEGIDTEEIENIEEVEDIETNENIEIETPIIIKPMNFSEGIENTRKLTDYAKNISEEIFRLIEESESKVEYNDIEDSTEDGVREQTIQLIEYEPIKKLSLNMKKSKKMEYDFSLNNSEVNELSENGIEILLPESNLENLISSEELDVDTLESENDELLQEIFMKTHNIDVMNLVIKTYLSEYQFIKAKNFIESLDVEYLDNVSPLLNLQVSFNSFALTSKTISSTLSSIVENYKTKGQISEEDMLWYMGVISLMQQDYNHFFELANNFTVENHKNFASKLQGYKDQIAKQMGMPDYYFDTLVALELFNQGLFQPAKVLALYSLQQNSDYILPYQILAYANFLTNSWDTSIEYMKKLIDLDPNNAEKYRFLMGIAYYRDKKYEQSVLMLSLIKSQNLRLDADRYLIRDYIFLDQKNKLISIRNKLLGYENLVASDFYTYFNEAFYRPFAEGLPYEIYVLDTELSNKMIRLCNIKLPEEEKAVCNYGMIGKNVALGQYDGLENSLLNLATEYPQGYLYQALGEYYIHQGDSEKGKVYLLKAISMTHESSEIIQIKKLLQKTM